MAGREPWREEEAERDEAEEREREALERETKETENETVIGGGIGLEAAEIGFWGGVQGTRYKVERVRRGAHPLLHYIILVCIFSAALLLLLGRRGRGGRPISYLHHLDYYYILRIHGVPGLRFLVRRKNWKPELAPRPALVPRSR